jgi:hypothetical protein
LLKHHATAARERIKVSQLINRLQDHADGKTKMQPTQIQAARILLNKCLPDLRSTELVGDSDRPIITKVERHIVDPDHPNG